MTYHDAFMQRHPQGPLPNLSLSIGNNLRSKDISHFQNKTIQISGQDVSLQTAAFKVEKTLMDQDKDLQEIQKALLELKVETTSMQSSMMKTVR